MVAVALDEALQLAHSLRVGRHHARLVQHQHSHAVAGVQELRRRRVVRGAAGVRAHPLQPLQPVCLNAVRNGLAHARVILVVARPLDLHRLAVEEEPLVRIEAHGANAKGLRILIDNLAVHLDRCHRTVQVGRLQRPDIRMPHNRMQLEGGFVAGLNRRLFRHRRRHGLSRVVHQCRMNSTDNVHVAVVDDLGVQTDGDLIGACNHPGNGPEVGPHIGSPARDVHRRGLVEPHMAIDARALVEPSLVERRIHPYDQDIRTWRLHPRLDARRCCCVRARRCKPCLVRRGAVHRSLVREVGEVRQVEIQRRIAAHVLGDEVAVEEDCSVAEDSIELNRDASPCIAGRQHELSPVPANAGLGILAAQGLCTMPHQRRVVVDEGKVNRPVVRQIDLAPRRIVEARRSRPAHLPCLGEGARAVQLAEAEVLDWIVGIAQGEAPAEVQQQPLAQRVRLVWVGMVRAKLREDWSRSRQSRPTRLSQ